VFKHIIKFTQMKTIFYPESKRGKNDLGWLKANFSFSFGNYYDPEKMHFGALRVLNDDMIGAGKGFGMHPHDNMEIVTIVLKGALEHKDSLGNVGTIKAGDIQVMSAGTGVMHSEYNPSPTEDTSSLQIWLFPKEKNIEPRYDQKSFADRTVPNQLNTLISPKKSDHSLWINQDATFSIGKFDAGQVIDYRIKKENNGAYLFLLEGEADAEGNILIKRDAIGIYDINEIKITAKTDIHILILDVPMY
jgi:redox-sensitive bicupin YhaK (pirin superfamily)